MGREFVQGVKNLEGRACCELSLGHYESNQKADPK